jgi:hypothetical protein
MTANNDNRPELYRSGYQFAIRMAAFMSDKTIEERIAKCGSIEIKLTPVIKVFEDGYMSALIDIQRIRWETD